jgi:anaerobic ribonucleoside-triphosphate reductase activating protein
LEWSAVIDFLNRRRGLLDAVVFSGGEPTLQDNLKSAISEVRDLGFRVGLHTGGIYPSRLGELLPLLSWVGMDIKAVFSDYDKVTGTPKSGERARESARRLLDSGVPYEFRTTVHPIYHTQDSLLQLAEELQQLGVKHYLLQEFRSHGCTDEIVNSYADRELLDDAICSRIGRKFESFSVRRA